MATERVHVRWGRAERRARVANGFERPHRAEGMTINVAMPGSGGGYGQPALQEAYELGRRSAR